MSKQKQKKQNMGLCLEIFLVLGAGIGILKGYQTQQYGRWMTICVLCGMILGLIADRIFDR